MCSWSVHHISDFIDIYRDHPCLWQVNNPSYNNRYLREEAYMVLIEFNRTFDKSATRNTVVRKINNLRTSYKKEVRKVKESKETANSPEEVYRPQLWYYPKMRFLEHRWKDQVPADWDKTNDDDDGSTSKDSDDDESNDNQYTQMELDMKCLPDELTDAGDYVTAASEGGNAENSVDHLRPTTSQADRQSHRKLENNDFGYKHQMVANASSSSSKSLHSNHFGQRAQGVPFPVENPVYIPPPVAQEDQFDVTGKYVASKLRSVSREQRLFAEKLINEALFMAEFGSLTSGCRIISPKAEDQD